MCVWDGIQPRAAEARVRSQAGPSELLCWAKDIGTVFLPLLQISPVSLIPPILSTPLHLNTTFTIRAKGGGEEAWETPQQ